MQRCTCGILAVCLLLLAGASSAVQYMVGESLRVTATSAILREDPWQGSRVLATLDEYDHLVFLGEYTVEPTTVTLRGQRVTAPFLQVRTNSGLVGWIFGGLVDIDDDTSLLRGKVRLVGEGATRAQVTELYGRDQVLHDRRMTSTRTRELLDRLGTDEAWEFYYFREGEGVAFGFVDNRVAAVSVRQDVTNDDGEVTTFWRSVAGYLSRPLRPECHQIPSPASCFDYLR
ncbi:hypothetical protein NFC81_13705 [Salinispirillum sp. LH 10-3-1]|uniref:SH3 domain-containing protein n=1 Tax=Salinispirillum sp. LH 10-3-1 TaxID=2952525 RepID=A0AB38YEM4_9GAMM